MEITMNDSHITNITQIKEFLKGSQGFDFSLRNAPIEKKYKFIDKTVDMFSYVKLRKKDKKVVISYLKKLLVTKKHSLKD